jgi:hypothetical protein
MLFPRECIIYCYTQKFYKIRLYYHFIIMFNIYIAWRVIFGYKLHTICFVVIQQKKFGIKPHVYCPKNYIQITFKICSFHFISPSIDPLQGQRPTGCGSSQGTLNSYRDYYWILRVKITLKYIVLDLKLEYTVTIHWVSALLCRSVWLRLILVPILVQGFLGLQIL